MMELACLLVLAMMLIIVADVGLRNLGGRGLPWSNEASEDILYLVTLLAGPWLLRQGQHIRVDILLRALPARFAWQLEWVSDLLGLACCLYFVWYGWQGDGCELPDWRRQYQDVGHARMVAAGAGAHSLSGVCHRVLISHASSGNE